MKTTTKRTTSAPNCYVMFSLWISKAESELLKSLSKSRGTTRAQVLRDGLAALKGR